MMLTNEAIRRAKRTLRERFYQIAWTIIVDRRNWWEEGNMVGGLPVSVCEWEIPAGQDDFMLCCAPVDHPWLACTELGME